MSEKFIVTAALTGAIHTPSMSPDLPITPAELAEEARRAREAGAAVVHVHARNPETGQPSADSQLFGDILAKIKNKSDAVICTTTGGGFGMTVEQRVSVVKAYSPELASLKARTSLKPLAPNMIIITITEVEAPSATDFFITGHFNFP